MIGELFEDEKRVTVITCDRCGTTISSDMLEVQECFSIRFKGGYSSVFGDENIVEGDFCQDCIYELLGKYCRVRECEPYGPAQKIQGAPEKIYQPNQLPEAE